MGRRDGSSFGALHHSPSRAARGRLGSRPAEVINAFQRLGVDGAGIESFGMVARDVPPTADLDSGRQRSMTTTQGSRPALGPVITQVAEIGSKTQGKKAGPCRSLMAQPPLLAPR